MARRVLFVFAVALAVGCVTSSALAAELTIDEAKYRQGNGGEFLVYDYDGVPAFAPPATIVMQHEGATSNQDFITFCIEWEEHINLPSNYDYTVDTAAIGGSFGAENGKDELSNYTAKLFYAFWTGQLDSAFVGHGSLEYDYGNDDLGGGNRSSHGAQLQIALWHLEGEDDGGGSPDAPSPQAGSLAAVFVAFAKDVTWSELGTDWDDDGIGDVRVLNLYNQNASSSNAQSQLIVLPLPAGALMGFVLLAGMGGVSVIRRRRLN